MFKSEYPTLLRSVYSLFFYLLVPFVLIRLYYRSRREPEYRQNLEQRFGFYRPKERANKKLIWVHAVSAGETIAAVPLVRQLVAAGHHCLVTNMTPTGRDRVRSLLGDVCEVENAYAPYDLPGAVDRFLRNTQPDLFVTVDTELWPNILRQCRHRGIPTCVVNGRLSERSARRYNWIKKLAQEMVQSIDMIATQTDQHAKRFLDLGAQADKVVAAGSIKFDAEPSEGYALRVDEAVTMTAGRTVITGASTHAGEESILLSVLPELLQADPQVLLVLVPRHTHRAHEITQRCVEAGYPALHLSQCEGQVPSDCAVLLLDTMGQLDAYYAASRIAFVGGSMVPVGGHNLLEAVRAGCAVVMGPHLHNIDDIAGQFVEADGMRIAEDEGSLCDVLLELMNDPSGTATLKENATGVLERNRGALARVLRVVADLLEPR